VRTQGTARTGSAPRRRSRRALGPLAAAAVCLAALAGCGSSNGSAASGDARAADRAPVASSSGTPSAPAGTAPAAGEYDAARNAAADIAAAKAASAEDGRPVLIDFGANWCPDCRVLGVTFTRPATAALVARYHLVRVDVGQFDHNLQVVARYVDLSTSGIPALAVVNPQGRTEVATNQGEFANARSMTEDQVDTFLKKWA